ncbi:hypothetical protein QQS21_008802 [Conoideocrella luteorostrata]|uniref:Uncharacterized protein n=1 Tax=Conoideocrella luteorostrata TaxID=1105319 RepID=A0AAJ0FQV4_9HYPO|nr:hypothetical protein QQS21_008802 [Conoideocrella luteorostrata]
MTQSGRDVSPSETIRAVPIAAASASMKSTRYRHSMTAAEDPVPSSSVSKLPLRGPKAASASLYASTLSPPGSRPMSPARQISPGTAPSESVFDRTSGRTLSDRLMQNPEDPLYQIIHSFVPHVSIYASEDTETLVSKKGFQYGLWELLRPFGENVPGRVTVRDSNGISRGFEDFSIRFTQLGENVERPDPIVSIAQHKSAVEETNDAEGSTVRDKAALDAVETLVERHLAFAEVSAAQAPSLSSSASLQDADYEAASPYYSLYLRRLLSGTSIKPHETFAHPVACVIAISSRNDTPIEELRKLYAESNQGNKGLPLWVDNDYLRYYLLVHDEENDDITRSMGLFEQMKRHLGLHCHLLRLRFSKSAETDDESIPLPDSDWMSAPEELARIQKSESEGDFEVPTQYIFESDATAIRTFIREMVTQSIVPTMERHISVWNDQVASRRRGITGRFMNLSRKWAGFGGGHRSSSGSNLNLGDNYDNSGYYRAEAAEAVIRKLADYAFMLRDWKLAHSTYDLLRSDFSESKAWKYHAATNEMAAISLLMAPQSLVSKGRTDIVDQMLESAFYSYNTRCRAPFGAVRCLLIGVELLRVRGGPNIDGAGRWGLRLLEARILGRVGEALLKERLCICYSSKLGVGSWGWGSRNRKASFWSMLAAEAWCQQGKYLPAQKCIRETRRLYGILPPNSGTMQFQEAKEYIGSLQIILSQRLYLNEELGPVDGADEALPNIDIESHAFTSVPS